MRSEVTKLARITALLVIGGFIATQPCWAKSRKAKLLQDSLTTAGAQTTVSLPATSDTAKLDNQTQTVLFSSLPSEVRNAATREYGRGEFRACKVTERGLVFYEIEAIRDGMKHGLQFTEQGELVNKIREVPFESAPLPVQNALRKKYPDVKFATVQLVTSNFYLASFDHGGFECEEQVDASGYIESDSDDEP